MQRRHALRDDQWERIKDALPGKIEDPGRICSDNRLFVEAVMWIAKTGAPGEIYPQRMANGRMSTKDSCCGQRMVFGSGCR
jgi:transposase